LASNPRTILAVLALLPALAHAQSAEPPPEDTLSADAPPPGAPTPPPEATAETPPDPTEPTTSPPPAPVPPAPPTPPTPRHFSIAFEVGYGWTADDQAFGNGFGRVLAFTYKAFEMRLLEDYDLEDRSKMAANIKQRGRMGLTSFSYRMNAKVGPLALRPLLGVAWVRRSNLVIDDGYASPETRSQHGLALQAGGGVQLVLGRIQVGADLRVYPTHWFDIAQGTFADGPPSRGVLRNDQFIYEQVTGTPGGIPRTATAWLAINW
jgi:hypothetical protein